MTATFAGSQEPIDRATIARDYDLRTHYTNMDTFERVREQDMKQSAIVFASFALAGVDTGPEDRPTAYPGHVVINAMLKVGRSTRTLTRIPLTPSRTPRAICSNALQISGYDALAVTLHDRYFDPEQHAADAARCGILLLSGIERTIQGKHLLLINFPEAASRVQTFDDVRALKARTNGLVVAPHPFYPVPSALRGTLDRLISLIDAIEINAISD